jgi:hypothetical protein
MALHFSPSYVFLASTGTIYLSLYVVVVVVVAAADGDNDATHFIPRN